MEDLYANWAQVYDLFHAGRDDEVAFWADAARPYGSCLLDLMCGTAQVSLGLARKGFQVLGVDRSPVMLAVGAERLEAAADYPARHLELALGDAGAVPAKPSAFDFCLVGGNGSLNHLADELVGAALLGLARVLRPGGGLGLELLNPYLLQEIDSERTFGPLRPVPPGVWVERTINNHYDRRAGRFEIHQVTRFESHGKRSKFTESFALSVWEPADVRTMLERAGFEDLQFFGSYARTAFDRWSADQIVIARCGARAMYSFLPNSRSD